MLESLFNALCKIGTLFKFSSNKTCSPSTKVNASTKNGISTATSGDNSPVYIGGNHVHHADSDHSATQSEAKKDSDSKFRHCLVAVAHELPYNFRHRGNVRSPFLTKALEKLVHDEPMVHSDLELYQKASHCLNTAQTLSTADPYHPILKPSDGQFLMTDLAEYISNKYDIKGPSQL